MTRPLRIEFPGAVYHVTARGDRREPIFVDDEDRQALLAVVGQAMARVDAVALAYCLMGNHYHFVLCTRQGRLSQLMRHINGVFTQWFNRRHTKVGHLFQGRFKAILVDRDAYLLEVCRYTELNPVRAGLVAHASAWPWSSYRAHVGDAPAPPWLDTAALHALLVGREARGAALRLQAQRRYAQWVEAGRDQALWAEALQQQIYLGDEAFVARMLAQYGPPAPARDTRVRPLREVPRVQQRPAPRPLGGWLRLCGARDEALYRAYTRGGLSMTALAEQAGLSVSRVSRIVAQVERAQAAAPAAEAVASEAA